MDNKDFKMKNLKKIREHKNITQTKLSVDVEVSQEIISHYEIGDNKPNIDNLIKLADYFRCSTDYLLNRTDIPTMVQDLVKGNQETNDIIYKYNSLSDEDKSHLKSFLDYLFKKDNK